MGDTIHAPVEPIDDAVVHASYWSYYNRPNRLPDVSH
jgi:hypothetical protein